LHLACLALGVGKGDRVWTSPITFVASANCALYCGASVDFVDIDSRTYNMSVECLAEKLKDARASGSLPKVVIPVHLCGQPCDMLAIHALGREYGFRIIEDASHAIGARYRGDPIGNCRYSDIAVFSFHPVKIVTTGEGGMAVTNDAGLAARMQLLRSHGITRDPSQMSDEPDGPWYYQQIDLGFNYRMTDLQAALGESQFSRVDAYVARRHVVANAYHELLADLPVIRPWQHPEGYSAFHLYVIRLRLDSINRTHRQVFESLRSEKVGVSLHYIPVHTQPYFRRTGNTPCSFPEASRYYGEAITLPMYPGLTDIQQEAVICAIRRSL
jgi:UDP-4-amino-4,6-dideoxy-N-acetyl-beta-L-altrosamine transaminase